MTDQLRGGCLCGGVQYEVEGTPSLMASCHCTLCQRLGGGAHSTVLLAKREDFRLVKGQELLRTYSEDGFASRTSCTACGSKLYGEAPGNVFIAAGTLSDDPGMRPQLHIMVDYKAPWHEITDALPQFPEWPPHD